MSKTIIAIACLILLAVGVTAQSNNQASFPSNPDGFREFVLNESTAETVIKSLGQPAKDKTDKLEVSKVEKWLDPKHKEKIFRQLTYGKVGDFYKMEFSFLDDKLVMIELEFKKSVSPEKLKNLFGVGFAPLGGPASLPDKPGQYPIPFFVTTFPPAYSMIGISEKTFIYVNCTTTVGDPGRVERTRQVSRVLEKR